MEAILHVDAAAVADDLDQLRVGQVVQQVLALVEVTVEERGAGPRGEDRSFQDGEPPE